MTMPITDSRRQLRPAGQRLAVGVVAALAVLGLVVAAWQIRVGTASSGPAAVGEAVSTDYGSLTVTHTSKTFVPDTQGPPTAAQHAGVNGSDNLQVWVRFVNTEAENGVRYTPRRFRLVPVESPGRALPPAGSTLTPDRLPLGSSIDGQLWFELAGAPDGRYRLVYAAPGAEVVRVSLGRLNPTTTPDESHHHEH